TMETGNVYYRPGYVQTGRAFFKLKVQGKGGHGSSPHMANDAIVAGSYFVTALQTVVSRRLSPFETGVVTIGSFDGKGQFNVIKDVVEIEGGCCSLSAVEDARRVANKIGIPFYVLNFREVFKEKVIDYFIDEYLEGKTPNPCIACNKHIKFDDFYKKARQIGCDYVATGHYAKIEKDESTGRYLLKKSVTDKK
ncbi:peptidase dimerization domain-containing protein, partial [Acinetobacter baumannii]|nr:peptidase dimerization domain-containing protein [Acinetobacter baumannii]